MKVVGKRSHLVLFAAAAVTSAIGAQAQQTAAKAKPITAKLELDATALSPDSESKIRLGYMPVPVVFTDKKPEEIKKEPAYKGTPLYATIHLGNGPKSAYNLVFDEPAEGDWKVYIDKNRNGDLTDDGDGAWIKKVPGKGRTVYGVNNYVLRASWGNAKHESGHGDYGIGLYQIATSAPAKNAFMYRQAARIGEIEIAGKTHKVLLAENDGDALFNKPIATDTEGNPTTKPTTKPVWMIVDLKDEGKFAATSDSLLDVRAPFKLADNVYEASISDDGFKVTLTPTTRAVAQLIPKPKPLLAAGLDVPDFKCEAYGGGTVQPADFKGKILIVDFWATWCGPCQASMPHLEKVYQAVKDKNVAVLAICVWDEKDAYTKWVPINQSKYTFPLAFDPAARDTANSIAAKLFHVSGIPTTYIIGPDGKIADSLVGYDSRGDHRLEDALKKLGVDVSIADAKPATATKTASTNIPTTPVVPAAGASK